jgi:hypothetical protein
MSKEIGIPVLKGNEIKNEFGAFVNGNVYKRIEFIDYKMKISEKEMFKYVNQALGRYGGI